jgi:hypothetical protein
MRTDKVLTEHFEELEREHTHLNEKLNSEIKNIEAFQFKPSDT